MSSHECEQARSLMIGMIEDELSILEKQRLDQHLDDCQDCRYHLTELSGLKAMSTQWKDIPEPTWDRRQNLFETPYFLLGFQYLSNFASILVLALVLTSAEISTKEGFSINFNRHYITRSELTQRLKSIESDQSDDLQTSVQKLTGQQVTTCQLLMKGMLTTSRVERREDLQQVFALVDEAQGQQLQLTNTASGC